MSSLGERLKSARKLAGLTQKELVEMIGGSISQQVISKIESGKSERTIYINQIASVLDVSPAWLELGKGEMKANVAELDFAIKRVPVISWVRAGNWSEAIEPYPAESSEHWELCPIPHSKSTFGLIVKGESMSPKFNDGDIIFCDPEKESMPGDYVIAKKENLNEATFKQLVVGDEEFPFFLKAINPDWNKRYMPCDEGCILVGKVIGRIEKF